MNLRDKLEFFREIFLFVKEKKQWVLIPVLVMIIIMIILLLFIEVPALQPFFYAIF